MAATSTFATEYGRLQSYCGDDAAATLTRIKDFVNDAYQELLSLQNWPWLYHTGAIATQAKYTTGTVSGSAGSATLTGSGTAWTSITNPSLCEVEIGNERYAISSVGADTTITLARNLVLAVAAGTTYTIFQRKYALDARMRATPLFYTGGSPRTLCRVLGPEPYALEAGQVVIARSPAEIVNFAPEDSSGNSQIRIWPVPDSAYSLHYEGWREPAAVTADGTAFLFPIGLLPAFRHLALAKLWAWRKDERMQAEQQRFESALSRVVEQYLPDAGRGERFNLDPHEFGDSGQFRETPPRVGMYD